MTLSNSDAPADVLAALARGDSAAALAIAERLADHAPDDAATHVLVARVHHSRDDMLRAVRAARRAIELDATRADAHALAGAAHLGLGRVREAISSLRQALALDSSQHGARRHLAHALAGEGRLRDALDTLAPIRVAALTPAEGDDVLALLARIEADEPDPRIAGLVERLRARAPDARPRVAVEERGRIASRSVLPSLGRDLTDLARNGSLDPVYGRDAEVDALIDVLLRRHKPNPLVTGPAGVGKTALLEALAQRIAAGTVPERLKGRRVVEISVAALVAGSSFRGELEARLRALLDEARAEPGLFLAIDEIHTLVGAGGMGTELDASEIVKPALARGELRVIGATTDDDYERVIARDPTLARRFTRIALREPDEQSAVAIAQSVARDLGAYHGVTFAAEAIASAVSLSMRFLPARRLPDKAVDVLDQSAVVAIRAGRRAVTLGDVQLTVARLANIAVESIRAPLGRHAELATRLAREVIGQRNACDTIARALVRHALRDESRSPAVLVFAGPPGTGKSLAARALARALHGRDEALVRVDVADLGEAHDLARLAGAPAGYAGHETATPFVRSLRADPSAVVVLEGIDRAHDRVAFALAQWFERGAMIDARGESVDLANAVFVLTVTTRSAREVGFAAGVDAPRENDVASRLPPELLARIDAIVSFTALDAEALATIAADALERARTAWLRHGLVATFDPRLAQACVERTAPSQDARALLATVDRFVFEPLADAATREPRADRVDTLGFVTTLAGRE